MLKRKCQFKSLRLWLCMIVVRCRKLSPPSQNSTRPAKSKAGKTLSGSIRQSMGRTHCCFDHARMESFFATLKKELIYQLHCISLERQQVQQMIFRWIETYYNRLRRNTVNEDNLPPFVKRRRWEKARSRRLDPAY